MTDEPKLAWVDEGNDSEAIVADQLLWIRQHLDGQWRPAVWAKTLPLAPTREAAKLAAEREARRIGMGLLAALGFDDAAVDAALDAQRGHQGWRYSEADAKRRGMRAALAAAVKEG